WEFGIEHWSDLLFDPHAHSTLRSQGDQRLWRDFVSRNEMCPPTGSQRCEYENRFGPRKTFTDATSLPAAEWKIGILRPRLLCFGCPPVRIESSRVRKESSVAMRNKRAEQNDGIGRDNVASNPLVHQRATANSPCRRIESYSFGDDHLRVREARNIFH